MNIIVLPPEGSYSQNRILIYIFGAILIKISSKMSAMQILRISGHRLLAVPNSSITATRRMMLLLYIMSLQDIILSFSPVPFK